MFYDTEIAELIFWGYSQTGGHFPWYDLSLSPCCLGIKFVLLSMNLMPSTP